MADTQNMSLTMMRAKLLDAKSEVKDLEARILQAEQRCKHSWGEPVAAHQHYDGYQTAGDTPGTMGVDFRGPQYIPPRTEMRWRRTCANCNKTEFSTQVKEETIVKKIPVFPT